MTMGLMPIQLCGVVAVLCGAWNLFGDLCFIDFYLAHMNFDGFGTIDTFSRPGNIFNFNQDWPLKLAQAGGWMYPVWAFVTAYPLYVGINSVWPCALLAYGLCVVGGAIHSSFAFATILPRVLHIPQRETALLDTAECHPIMQVAQKKLMDSYVFGYTPGPIAVLIASGWIAYIVFVEDTKFPKWFVLCTPLVTIMWIAIVGFLLMSKPLRMYFVCAFGTWIILVMNLAASWILWDVEDKEAPN